MAIQYHNHRRGNQFVLALNDASEASVVEVVEQIHSALRELVVEDLSVEYREGNFGDGVKDVIVVFRGKRPTNAQISDAAKED